ncbi:MAG: protein phosphatase [Spirochaetes bacterium]|nr:protein phosphatase [Spirochaetota bacterium]
MEDITFVPPSGMPGAARSTPVPHPRSYWVVPGLFLAGSHPVGNNPGAMDSRLGAILDAGIRRVVCLMEAKELGPGDGRLPDYAGELARMAASRGLDAAVLARPIPDYGVPAPRAMRGILDDIDDALTAGLPVYIHCWGGRGRTGTVVGCWLSRHGIARGEAVLDEIRALRAGLPDADEPSPESPGQLDMVTGWGAG